LRERWLCGTAVLPGIFHDVHGGKPGHQLRRHSSLVRRARAVPDACRMAPTGRRFAIPGT
jgi:hypothetical protein